MNAIAVVCLIVSHLGPAAHFAVYEKVLADRGFSVQIFASGHALNKFHELGYTNIVPFSAENLNGNQEEELAAQIALSCADATIVVTDIGHAFGVRLQKALGKQAPRAKRFAYYDNPEPFVPGGYSQLAAQVMLEAEGTLFANEKLADETLYSDPGKAIDFGGRKRIGIGYYPTSKAEELVARRKIEYHALRIEFLKKFGIQDNGQKVLVYFGGNNETYFSSAFPAFLHLLQEAASKCDLSDSVIVIQQHPGAKEKNIDGEQLTDWLQKSTVSKWMPVVILSDISSDDVQVIAEAAFYYQTSMSPQFILVGIPTFQIGSETYDDILVRNRLAPSIVSSDALVRAIRSLEGKGADLPQKAVILESLGIRNDWEASLEQAMLAICRSP